MKHGGGAQIPLDFLNRLTQINGDSQAREEVGNQINFRHTEFGLLLKYLKGERKLVADYTCLGLRGEHWAGEIIV